MRQVSFLFTFGSMKNSAYINHLSSRTETSKLLSFEILLLKFSNLQFLSFAKYANIKQSREVLNCLVKDMLHLVCMWRQIRGYPQGGNTTHTNAKNCKKNKLLLTYRLRQFEQMFGSKNKDLYVTLIKAEYNNRLYFYNWIHEWQSACWFALKCAINGLKFAHFDPVLLASNRTNGYVRRGRAATMSKLKKLVKVYTIGVPLLFTRYIYWSRIPKDFPRIQLTVFKQRGRKRSRSRS
jgi:hypothetical protein